MVLQRLRNGDERAFKTLFDVYYTPLCLYSLQITGSLQQSEDVVQDLFVAFWEKKIYNRINTSLEAYLFYSVRNSSLALARENALFAEFEEIEEEAETLLDDLYDEEELQQRFQRLHEALKKLSPQEYRVLTDIIIDGKAYKQVAADLNISLNTVKTHLARAMKLLRADPSLAQFC
jgi:RNA polymerase sigma-70 factor (ECF subfamily)